MRQAEFDAAALEDLVWWVQHERKTALRLLRLIRETLRTPFEGTGKPEPLRHDLKGAWSRRITHEHRLVYKVFADRVRFVSCRYHYR